MGKKKDSFKVGLGDVNSFLSQFFSNLSDDWDLEAIISDLIANCRIVKYACKTSAIFPTQDWGMVMYTPVLAIVEDNERTTYEKLQYWFTRGDSYAQTMGSIRYDTVWVPDEVQASWSAYLTYIQTSGCIPSLISEGLIGGQGLLYNLPCVTIRRDPIGFPWPSNDPWITNEVRNALRAPAMALLDEKRKGSPLAKMAKDAIQKSKDFWPEIQGMGTRFIDNVGVYMPNYLDVDYNLSGDLGSSLVGCWMTRLPTSGMESFMYKFDMAMQITSILIGMFAGGSAASQGAGSWPPFPSTLSTLGGGSTTTYIGGNAGYQGGAAAGIAAGTAWNAAYSGYNLSKKYSLDSIRLVIPRIRAFGRQYTPDFQGNVFAIPTYEEALARCIAVMGAPQDVSSYMNADALPQYKDAKLFSYGYKRVLLLPKQDYDKFVTDMSRLVASQTTGSGGLQGFPY